MEKRLKIVRKEAGLTQAEFGEKIGVKGNTIANYEVGYRVPLDAVITAICREFRVSETWLRTGEGEMHVETADMFISRVCAEKGLNANVRTILHAVAEAFTALDDETASLFADRLLAALVAKRAEEMQAAAAAHVDAADQAADADQTAAK